MLRKSPIFFEIVVLHFFVNFGGSATGLSTVAPLAASRADDAHYADTFKGPVAFVGAFPISQMSCYTSFKL